MVGFNDLAERIELVTNPSSAWIVDLMAAAGQRYDLGLQVDVLEDRYAGLSDHAPFWAQGYDAILAIENYLPTDSTSAGVVAGDYRVNTHYHTVADLPDSINWELVTGMARLTLATLAQFGAEEGLPNLAVFGGGPGRRRVRGPESPDLQPRSGARPRTRGPAPAALPERLHGVRGRLRRHPPGTRPPGRGGPRPRALAALRGVPLPPRGRPGGRGHGGGRDRRQPRLRPRARRPPRAGRGLPEPLPALPGTASPASTSPSSPACASSTPTGTWSGRDGRNRAT